MTVSNQLRGARAQRQGKGFEAELLFYAERIPDLLLIPQYPGHRFPSRYERQRYRLPPGWVQITKKGWCDFIGMIHGRAFTFDAKSTINKTRFQVPANKRHQFEKLRRASAGGTLAFYLIGWLELERVSIHYVTPEMKMPQTFHPAPQKKDKQTAPAYVADMNPSINWFKELFDSIMADW